MQTTIPEKTDAPYLSDSYRRSLLIATGTALVTGGLLGIVVLDSLDARITKSDKPAQLQYANPKALELRSTTKGKSGGPEIYLWHHDKAYAIKVKPNDRLELEYLPPLSSE